ncbi:MAG: GNAT family N-acetyltransferase [Pyrinomonadaceae bacterium]
MEIGHKEQKKKGTFFVEENGETLAKLEYFHSAPDEITIYHTEVNAKLHGKHIGDKLVEAVVNFARENGVKVVPTCSFANKVIDRTPEYQDVLA